MKLKFKMNKRGTIAISQIALLIVSLFAITFLISLSMPTVKAEGVPCGEGKGTCLTAKECDTNPVNDNACATGLFCCIPLATDNGNSGGGSNFGAQAAGYIVPTGLNLLAQSVANWVKQKGSTPNLAPADPNLVTVQPGDANFVGPLEYVAPIAGIKATFGTGLKYAFFKGGTIVTTSTDATTGVVTTVQSAGATMGAIFGVVLAAAAAVALVHYGTAALGAGERNVRGMTNAGIISGSTAVVVLSILLIAGASTAGFAWIAAGAVLVAAGIWALFSYQDYSQEVFSYIPSLWQPVYGGQKCEQCNELDSGCNDYQCHSFGKGCALFDEGLKSQACVWINPNDMTSPEIQPMESVLRPDHSYTPLEVNLPSDRGVKILYSGQYSDENNCILPFTPLKLGVNTSQPSHCKIDLERKSSFDLMLMDMVDETAYNHTFVLPSASLASSSSLAALNLSLRNGNGYSYFIRCINANGVESAMQFEMQFCVQDGPDPTAPEILYTNILNNSACVLSDKTENPLEVYTNEPADCKWDFNNVNYDDMGYSMSCSRTVADNYPKGSMTYGCTGTLEGIQKAQENTYYIKCKDQPWLEGIEDTSLGKRNANQDPFVVVLQGSQPLVITDLTINDQGNNINIKDSTETVPVTISVNTLSGCKDGNARCAHGELRNGRILYTDFYNEGSFDYMPTNTETLHLPAGTYALPIRCVDEGGNAAETQANFTIESDLVSPVISRAYYEDNNLKIITNEKASCVYGDESTGCTFQFEDGSAISTRNGIEHFVKWDTTADLFIRCKDQFGNMPAADQCNIIVRAYEKKA